MLRSIFITLGLLAYFATAYAQVEEDLVAPTGVLEDIPSFPDSIVVKPDSVVVQADSLKAPKGDIETTIHYSAKDSININMENKIAHLYGDAKVTYGSIELNAEEIIIDYEKNTISAKGTTDSTGRRIGFPVFKDGGQVYETKEISYNIKDRKAKILEVVTQQGDGFLHGDAVFKNERNELFCINNAYTTCDLVHPHFRILAKRTKAIPGDKMVTGPFRMEFNDVPTPFGFIFGIFPSQRKSSSGIIFPSYGEEGRRGFFLRGGGYFFDINDFVKLRLTGDLYSKGSSALFVQTNYNKRYRYTGNLNFSYTNTVVSEKIEDRSRKKDFYLTWSHSPKSKGSGRFSASVTAATGTYTSNNYVGLNQNVTNGSSFDQVTRNMSSNISYSKTFRRTPLSMGVNMRHNQDLVSKRVTMSLPNLTLNLNNVYPLKNSESLFLKNFNFRYSMQGANQISNSLKFVDSEKRTYDSIAPFNLENLGTFLKYGKKGVKHNIPISTSFKTLKYLTVSTSFNYEETWYFEKLQWGMDSEKNVPLVTDTLSGFHRISTYSTSLGLNTRLYGTFLSKKPNARIKAIRHVVNPSVSFNYRPDFGESKYGYYSTFETLNSSNNTQEIVKSNYDGFLYGNASSGKSAGIGFGIGNSLEMKVRSPKDTVDRKVSILNSLSISGSYNFLADSMKLSNLSISANTNVLNNKININFNSTLDPYQYEYFSTDEYDKATNEPKLQERRIDKLVWRNIKFGRITQASLAFSTSLNPKGREKNNAIREKAAQSNTITEEEKQDIIQNADRYIDFSIPWNLNINYSMSYSHGINSKPKVTHNLRFSGDVSLSEKWKISANSGYDFLNNEFVQTHLQLSRDLHCWSMSLSWVPFGRFQSYNFSIGVKSSLLRDLKLDRNRSFFDNY